MLIADLFDEAVEFGNRFPDVSELDFHEHIEYVLNRPIMRDSILFNALLIAFKNQNAFQGISHLDNLGILIEKV